MKKIGALFLLILFLLSCDGKTDTVSFNGEIIGLGNDSILLFGHNDRRDFTEIIYVEDDKFSHQFRTDTVSQGTLLINGNKYPVYFDKGEKINIKANIELPVFFEISGNNLNKNLTSFFQGMQTLVDPTENTIEEYAEMFIRRNPDSEISIYVLDKYFVQKNNPDYKKIKELISSMDGTLQDDPYINRIKELVTEEEKVETDKMAPSFSFTNAEGKKINRYDYRNKYLLLNFWASWCDSCGIENTRLLKIYRKFRKEDKFEMVGISLDMDKESWNQAVKSDTLQWEQVSELAGWSSSAVKQFNVLQIPYNILIDANGKIIERGITGDELEIKLNELLKK